MQEILRFFQGAGFQVVVGIAGETVGGQFVRRMFRFPVDVIALEECEIILIPKSAVMRLLATNEHFLQSYMAFNANRTQFLSERLQLLSIKTIKGKLAYYILKRIQGDHYKQDRNQTELSEYFGVARPSLARSFSEMIEEGAISREGKIVDMNKLKSYVL